MPLHTPSNPPGQCQYQCRDQSAGDCSQKCRNDGGTGGRDGRAHQRQCGQRHPESVGQIQLTGYQPRSSEPDSQPDGVLKKTERGVKWPRNRMNHSACVERFAYQNGSAIDVADESGTRLPCMIRTATARSRVHTLSSSAATAKRSRIRRP